MHGANRTGRPFTGDYAGILLYESLHGLGLASRPEALSADDGMVLKGVRITNAVKCLPPANKPTGREVRECNAFLAAEIAGGAPRAVLALGRIAHDATLKALGQRPAAWTFGHGAEHALPDGPVLVDSYHCSRYNTQTRRLTGEMFRSALARAAMLAGVITEPR
jgi:uracil-DNA glycosylase